MEDRWRGAEDELCHRCLSAAAVCLTVGLRIRSIVGSRGECAALTRQCPKVTDLAETMSGKGARETDFCLQIVLGRRRTGGKNIQYAGTYKPPLTPILPVSLPEPVRLPRSRLPQPDGACGWG